MSGDNRNLFEHNAEMLKLYNLISTTPTNTWDAYLLDELRNLIKMLLPTPLTKIATGLGGRKISFILSLILNDLDSIFSSRDIVFIDKYLLNNDVSVVSANITYTGTIYETISEEMLELFKSIGINKTGLLYLLVAYHMS